MARTYQISSIARLVGVPQLTAQRRIVRSGIKAAHHLVIVSGATEIVNPLFDEAQLLQVAAIARGDEPAKQPE